MKPPRNINVILQNARQQIANNLKTVDWNIWKLRTGVKNDYKLYSNIILEIQRISMNINNDTQTFTKSFPRVPGNRTKQMTSSKTKKIENLSAEVN